MPAPFVPYRPVRIVGVGSCLGAPIFGPAAGPRALRALGLDDDDAPLPAISYRPLDEVDLDQVVKATFISADSDTLARAQADLGDAFHVIPGSIPMPGGSNGEIAQLGVNKGSAIFAQSSGASSAASSACRTCASRTRRRFSIR